MITADHARIPAAIALQLCAESPEALAVLCRVLWFARGSGECFASCATMRMAGAAMALPVLRRGLVALQDRGLLLAIANPERSCVTYRPTSALAKSPRSVFVPPEVWRGFKPAALAAWVVWRLTGCDAGELPKHLAGRAGKQLSRSQGYALFRTLRSGGVSLEPVRKSTGAESEKDSTNTDDLKTYKDNIYIMDLSNYTSEATDGNMGHASDACGTDEDGRPRTLRRQARTIDRYVHAGDAAAEWTRQMDTGLDPESVAAGYQAGSCGPGATSSAGVQAVPRLRVLPSSPAVSQLSLPIRAPLRVVSPPMNEPMPADWLDWMAVSEYNPGASRPMPAPKVPKQIESVAFYDLPNAWKQLVAAYPPLEPPKVLASPSGLPPSEERKLMSSWLDCAKDWQLSDIPALAEYLHAGQLKHITSNLSNYIAINLDALLQRAEKWRKDGKPVAGASALQPQWDQGDILSKLTRNPAEARR